MISNAYSFITQYGGLSALVMSLVVSFGSLVSGQSTNPGPSRPAEVIIEVNGARPLASALLQVQAVTRVPVSFEETPHQYPKDLVKTNAVTHPGLKPRTIARQGRLSITLSPLGFDGRSDAFVAAQALIKAHREADLPGAYRLLYTEDGLEVVPDGVIDSNGAHQDFAPIMSRPVSIPNGRRHPFESLRLIMDNLSATTNAKIHLLNVPLAEGAVVSFGSTALPARDAVRELLKLTGIREMSYQLLYDANEQAYYFNLTPIPVDTPASTELPAMPRDPAKENPFFIRK